jgi:release factor glutamine methyltransferase
MQSVTNANQKQGHGESRDLSRAVVSGRQSSVVGRRLWKRLLQWKYRLFQRHRYDRLVLEEVAGKEFVVLPQVFNPKLFRTGEFMAETIRKQQIPASAAVLDMGTGTGVGAVFAAESARRVVAVDINPAAARCARINVLLNGAEERVEVRQGDLWEPVKGERFDVVLFNPPYFRGEPTDALDHAWRSNNVVERFAAGLRGHVKPGGYALVVLSSDGDLAAFLNAFSDNDLRVEIVASRDLRNETLTIYRLSPETK